jgi:serine/threonine-protein kinase
MKTHVLGGRYQLSQVIGSGGMGEIYRARRLHIGDTVAVKVLRPDVVENEKSRQRFYREARAAAMLHHPNAVVIHDFGEDTDGTAYIVMELLVGRSLRQVLIEEGTIGPLRCYGIIRQACAALDAGHRNGIVHRDIKPDNIILLDSNDGVDHVKILDFGIAKLRDQALDTLSMEQRDRISTAWASYCMSCSPALRHFSLKLLQAWRSNTLPKNLGRCERCSQEFQRA